MTRRTAFQLLLPLAGTACRSKHRHNPRGCDWIVCWIHDWPAVPRRIRVVELRREYGMGFNVWFQPIQGDWVDVLARTSANDQWSVPSLAIEDDLLLFYRSRPHQSVRDIFQVAGPVGYVRAGWKPGKDWMAAIKRVATLKSPIHLSDLRSHPVIRNAGFVRGGMRERFKATPYWAELHRLIIERTSPVRPQW